MRQFQFRVGPSNFALIHVSLIPNMHGEQKTKPTQSTVRDLRGLGLLPDLVRPAPLSLIYLLTRLMQVACRIPSGEPLKPETKAKISMFCHVGQDQVLGVHDLSSIYHVPLLLEAQGLVTFLQKKLDLLSLSLPREMIASGHDLHRRWEALTAGFVQSASSSNSHLLTALKKRAILRHRYNRVGRKVHGLEGLIHVRD
jgi:CTP synthase